MSLVVTGTIGIDTVYTPQGHAESVLGGSCVYFAAAASFHGPVRLVAVVGEDFPPASRRVIETFKTINLDGLETRAGSKTFRWGARYLKDMNSRETLFTELGVVEEHPPAVPEHYKDSEFVFLANSHPAVQLDMLWQFQSRRLAVADTMDLWIRSAREELLELLKRVDGLVLNYDEAELLTGKNNPVTAARKILELGPAFVVVKKGEHGSILVHREGVAALPAYPAERVIDPTGAGDSFAGGMMGSLAAASARRSPDAEPAPIGFDELRRALAHATVAASFTIESFALERLTHLTRRELADRFDEFVRMVRV